MNTKQDDRERVRKARLAAQLRANLQRRKAQLRSRREGDADQRPEGIDPSAAAARTERES